MYRAVNLVKKTENLFAVLTIVFFVLSFNIFSQNSLPVLELNASVEGELEAGESASFILKLDENKYAEIISRQISNGTFVRIYDPAGEKLEDVRRFIEPNRDNRFLLLPEKAGDYQIEILPLAKKGQKVKYELILKEVRDAIMPQDQFALSGQKALLEGERLFGKRDAASVKQSAAKFAEALENWQKTEDFPSQADAYSYLGVAQYATGDLPKALENTKKARFFYNKAGDKAQEAVAFRGIGLMHHVKGELDEALEFYTQGLEINREIKNHIGEANDLGNIGGIYQYRGEFQKALDFYGEALESTRKYPNKQNEARLLNNIGNIYRILGENQKALFYLKESLKFRREIGDLRGQGNTLNNIGLVHTALEDYPGAVDYFNQSIEIRNKVGDSRGASNTYNNLGFVKYKIGDYANALDLLTKSLDLKRKTDNLRAEAATVYIIGSVHKALENFDEALNFYDESLTLSRKVKDFQTEAATLKSLADIKRRKGNLEEAERLMQDAIKIIESLRARVLVQNLRTSFLASKQNFYKDYIALLMERHRINSKQNFDIKALQVSEKARARSLVDLLNESRTRISKGVSPELLNRKKQIQIKINSRENQRTRIVGRKGNENALEAIEKDLDRLLIEFEQINAQIRNENSEYAGLVEPEILEIEDVQNLLDKDSVLLEYSLGEKSSYVWLITKNSVRSFELPDEEKINASARRFYELLTARNHILKNESPAEVQKRIEISDRKIADEAENLSSFIVHPFIDQIDKKRLIVVSDGALRFVPFGALTDSARGKSIGDQTYLPLILKYEIVNLPSASTLAVLRSRINSEKKLLKNSVAVLADPVFSDSDSRVAESLAKLKNKPSIQNIKAQIEPDEKFSAELKRSADDLKINEFRRLRFSRREAKDITSFTPAGKKLEAVDFDADKELLMGRDLDRFQILHFATHGLLNNKNPELSGIVLSLVDERGMPKNGFLRLNEIYNLNIGADLVVLSACQTALGKEIKGEGLIGLTRGFMYAGAESVAASLWKVEDRATAELMKKFYRAMLKDGQKPSAALRTAQTEMWREGRWSSPYYWAAFTLQGEW